MIQAHEKWNALSRENLDKVARKGGLDWIFTPAAGHEMFTTSRTRYAHIERGSDEELALTVAINARAEASDAREAAMDAAHPDRLEGFGW
jgi:hypothetical protein